MTPAVARIFVVFLSIGLELVFLDEGVDASSKGAFSMKSSPSDTANEYCSGYTDRHGQWNNGFSCPKWGRPDQVYCCGSEHHRYCCPSQRETLTDDATNGFHSHGPLLAGLTVAALLTITFLFVASCYCCPCCVIYKRRKSRLQDRSSDSIDWQLGATTPIRYEIAASAAVSTSSNIDLRPPNPPPYDDKDAPPKYSSVCGVTTDRPILPYNGSYNYSRPHAAAGHSSSCAESTPSAAPQPFTKKQHFDVIGQQQSHVIGKHGHVANKQVPATGQQVIGQRNHVVGHVICQNGQRKFSRPSYHDPAGRRPEQDAVAGGRPNGYQGGSSSTLLNPHTTVGVRGGGGTSQNDDSHWRNDGDLQTSNYELCGGVH